MIDYKEIMAQWIEREARELKANEANQSAIFDALVALGIERVEITFDGYGDSGQIEDVSVTGSAEKLTGHVTYIHARWNGPDQSESCPLADAVEHLCYALLEQEHGGWQDNDGSCGTFTFDVAARAVELEYNGHYTDYETFTHTFGEA